MSTTGAVSIRGVSKRFGPTVALQTLDLEIPPGSFFSLLGPSGCGKTTLLQDRGGTRAAGHRDGVRGRRDIATRPAERRPFNMVFQSYALFPHMTVADNIGFGLTIGAKRERPSDRERRERVAEMLRLVGLESLSGRYPSELSGGQAQRVAVARA